MKHPSVQNYVDGAFIDAGRERVRRAGTVLLTAFGFDLRTLALSLVRVFSVSCGYIWGTEIYVYRRLPPPEIVYAQFLGLLLIIAELTLPLQLKYRDKCGACVLGLIYCIGFMLLDFFWFPHRCSYSWLVELLSLVPLMIIVGRFIDRLRLVAALGATVFLTAAVAHLVVYATRW